jgi:hypothetical protein
MQNLKKFQKFKPIKKRNIESRDGITFNTYLIFKSLYF